MPRKLIASTRPQGKSRFAYPKNNKSHAKMADLLSALPQETAVNTWSLVEHIVGTDRCYKLGAKKARHLCERLINTAETIGFIRRMPVKVVSYVPAELVKKSNKAIHKELLWVITAEGIAFLERYNRLMNYVPRKKIHATDFDTRIKNKKKVERFYMAGLGKSGD
jgi:hypothetical protein